MEFFAQLPDRFMETRIRSEVTDLIGLGTLVNTAAVLAGSGIGLFLKGGLKKRFQDTLMQGLGLATMFIGAGGAMKGMLVVSGKGLDTKGTMVLILSLVIGALLGELLNIELFLERLGERIRKRVQKKEEGTFVEGFVTSSLVICVGAMAIVGSLQDGMSGDPSTLYVKAALDFVIVLIFASTFGIGVMFSALPVFVYQGAMTLFASVLKPLFTAELIANLSFVGSVLIFAVGVNIAFGKKIKVANLLPAMLVPAVIQGIMSIGGWSM